MKTTASVTGPRGKVQLTFGVYGLKNFCKRLGCEPTITSVLSAFQGGTRLEAMSEIIRSGIEQTAVDLKNPIVVTDYEACEVLETATGPEGEKAMTAFFSSILNEDYDEWFARMEMEYEQATADQSNETDEPSEAEKKS